MRLAAILLLEVTGSHCTPACNTGTDKSALDVVNMVNVVGVLRTIWDAKN